MAFVVPRSTSLPSTIWYELHAREWPYKSQPAEAIIWQIGSGMKPNLTQTGMGKEILVSPPGLPPSTVVGTLKKEVKKRMKMKHSHSHNVEPKERKDEPSS